MLLTVFNLLIIYPELLKCVIIIRKVRTCYIWIVAMVNSRFWPFSLFHSFKDDIRVLTSKDYVGCHGCHKWAFGSVMGLVRTCSIINKVRSGAQLAVTGEGTVQCVCAGVSMAAVQWISLWSWFLIVKRCGTNWGGVGGRRSVSLRSAVDYS